MWNLKYLLGVTLAVCAISCTNEVLEDKTVSPDADGFSSLTESDLKMRELIAPLHGEGLDYVWESLEQEKVSTRSMNANPSNVEEVTGQFMQTDEVQNVIANYVESYAPVLTKSAVGEKTYTEQNIQKVLGYLNDFVQQCNDQDILQEIDRYLANEPLDDLDEFERSVLVLSLFVYEDSYHYWSNADNFNKWESLKDKPVTRVDWGAIWETVKKYANVDAAGAVSDAIGNAVDGAVGGAIVGGGAGAAAGAAAGFVGGAISGAVSSSVSEAMK